MIGEIEKALDLVQEAYFRDLFKLYREEWSRIEQLVLSGKNWDDLIKTTTLVRIGKMQPDRSWVWNEGRANKLALRVAKQWRKTWKEQLDKKIPNIEDFELIEATPVKIYLCCRVKGKKVDIVQKRVTRMSGYKVQYFTFTTKIYIDNLFVSAYRYNWFLKYPK